MTSLLDLPDEILLSIVRYCYWHADDSRLDLATVCRRLALPARVVLAEHASVHVGTHDEAHPPDDLVLFTRWLEKYKLVDSLKWTQLSLEDRRQYEVFKDALTLVAKSSSMTRFSVGVASNKHFWELKMLCDPMPEHFQNLKHLDLDTQDTSPLLANNIARICQLPKLETIEINHTQIIASLSVVAGQLRPSYDPPMKPFALRASSCRSPLMHIDLLHSILPYSPHLKELEVSLPGPGVRIEDRQSPVPSLVNIVPHPDQPFQPQAIESALKHVNSSLEYLLICTMTMGAFNHDTIFVHPSEHDNSVLDLSSFNKLQHLRISSCLWFGNYKSAAHEHEQESRNIWKLMPPRVEEVHIMFEGLQGIFVNLVEMYLRSLLDDDAESPFEEEFLPWWEAHVAKAIVDPEKLGWLHDLFDETYSGHLPSLRKVVLQECWSPSWGYWKTIDVTPLISWHVPERIELDIMIMVPKDMADECLMTLRSMGFSDGFVHE